MRDLRSHEANNTKSKKGRANQKHANEQASKMEWYIFEHIKLIAEWISFQRSCFNFKVVHKVFCAPIEKVRREYAKGECTEDKQS